MKNIKQIAVCATFGVLIAMGCAPKAPKGGAHDTASGLKFSVPDIPAMLTSHEQQVEFISTHYWDNFNFKDTSLISCQDYTEQAYVDFVNLLPTMPTAIALKGVTTVMKKAEADSAMYSHFRKLAEKYLYDPNSPMRNEELYIFVLQSVVANGHLPEIEKVRPRYQLELALRNRVGQPASDFEYTTQQGGKARLYSVKGDKVLLFFFHPECQTCKQVREYVAEHEINKMAQIVWVNPDIDPHLETIYDLRASPTLYLLGKDKTVLLKDAQIEQIEDYLKRQ